VEEIYHVFNENETGPLSILRGIFLFVSMRPEVVTNDKARNLGEILRYLYWLTSRHLMDGNKTNGPDNANGNYARDAVVSKYLSE